MTEPWKPPAETPLNVQPPGRVPVLDFGYVQWIETWGSDESIIEAARMSTAKGFQSWDLRWRCVDCSCLWRRNADATWSLADDKQKPEKCCDNSTDFLDKLREVPGDGKLLRFLWENKHSTPFEFAGMTIEVQAPIMVFREWHRHRTQSFAERSARYTPLPDNNYMPTLDRVMMGGGHIVSNRQAASVNGSDMLTVWSALEWLAELFDVYNDCEIVYQSGLRRGVPKELARLCVPVGRYTVMRASTDLRNWLGFCQLRLAKGAQYEIRVFAEEVHRLLKRSFPHTVALFDETRPA